MLLLPFLHKKFFFSFFNSAFNPQDGENKKNQDSHLTSDTTGNVKEAERSFGLLFFLFKLSNANQVRLGFSLHSAFSEQALW